MNTQQRILDFIIRFQHEKGFSPTFREIVDGVGLKSSSTVSGHLDRLEKKGLIKRSPASSRTILANDEGTRSAIKTWRRVSVRVLEVDEDGTFSKVVIGGKLYVLATGGR
ncbi:MarR family transcriptional regulator [Paenibacillus macerans]|uniref:LexA family protein n=1 Tax=Paenibacillus macerans TaxID=44252 RepID=UPI003D311BBC